MRTEQILEYLKKPRCTTDFCRKFGWRKNTVKNRLASLVRAGKVKRTRHFWVLEPVDISNDPVAVKKVLAEWRKSPEGLAAAERWKRVDEYLALHGHLPMGD